MSSLDRRQLLFGESSRKPEADVTPHEQPTHPLVSIDRRHFLAGIVALSLAPHTEARAELPPQDVVIAPTTAPEHSFSQEQYSETAIETGMVFLANTLVERFFEPFIEKEFGFKLGNAQTNEIQEMLESKPFQTFFRRALTDPLMEEGLYRLFPAVLISTWFGKNFNFGKGDALWSVGIPVSFLFAAHHNLTEGGIDTEYIPLSQFFGGLFLWHLMRTKGIDHAFLAHGAYNAAFLGVTVPLHKRFP